MPSSYVYNLGLAYSDVAQRHGERIAITYPTGERLTHAELDRLSNRIAHALLELGVVAGDVVALFHTKSVEAYASMLACLKLGVAYTNLDLTSPAARIAKMLETCKPSLVLSATAPDEAGPLGVRHHAFGDEAFQSLVRQAPDGKPAGMERVTGADPAYIMFTSGSTGFPKGAAMTHANVLNFVAWARTTFDIVPDDVFTNVNPMYFDNSVFDFYASLFNGAGLSPCDAELVRRPRDLVRAVGKQGCTIWFSVPSLIVYLLTTRAIEASDLASLRTMIFGGEGFPKPRLQELHRLIGDRVRLVNVYGPTECTCICSAYEVGPDDFQNLSELAPLGDIAPNFGFYIEPLDPADPDFGELLLYGANVGLGYFNDEERTRRSFVPDPRQPGFRRVMYRTGDLVRRGPEGWLHFKGRADNQIKHMGYRIELEEIEAAFAVLPDVDEVAVVYHGDHGETGHIVAFVATTASVDEDGMLSQVKRLIPPYMVPRTVRFLPALPKNANGKIDRAGLCDLAA